MAIVDVSSSNCTTVTITHMLYWLIYLYISERIILHEFYDFVIFVGHIQHVIVIYCRRRPHYVLIGLDLNRIYVTFQLDDDVSQCCQHQQRFMDVTLAQLGFLQTRGEFRRTV